MIDVKIKIGDMFPETELSRDNFVIFVERDGVTFNVNTYNSLEEVPATGILVVGLAEVLRNELWQELLIEIGKSALDAIKEKEDGRN